MMHHAMTTLPQTLLEEWGLKKVLLSLGMLPETIMLRHTPALAVLEARSHLPLSSHCKHQALCLH